MKYFKTFRQSIKYIFKVIHIIRNALTWIASDTQTRVMTRSALLNWIVFASEEARQNWFYTLIAMQIYSSLEYYSMNKAAVCCEGACDDNDDGKAAAAAFM